MKNYLDKPPESPSLLLAIWESGDPAAMDCNARSPWWANTLIPMMATVPAAIITGIWLAPDAHRLLSAGLVMIAGYLVAAALGRLNPARHHGHCDICQACSAEQGVATARTAAQANRDMVAAGWSVSADGRREHCTFHATFPFL